MKKLIAISGLLLMSFGTMADTCHTQMVDYMGYVRVVFTQQQPNYWDPYCRNGYNQCLQSIHLNPALRPHCRVVRGAYSYGHPNPAPQPRPQPRPAPAPAPRPQWNPGDDGRNSTPPTTTPPRAGSSSGRIQPPARSTPNAREALTRTVPRIEVDVTTIDMNTVLTANGEEALVEVFDGQREIEVGETVLMMGQTYTVVSAVDNSYEIQLEGSRRKKDIVRVKRDKISVTRGCALNVCVADLVYNVSKGKVEGVAGITTEGELITKAENGKITETPVRLGDVALVKGCVQGDKGEICVGSIVQASNNLYYEIIGIQHDRNLVVRQDSSRTIYSNVGPGGLTVVK